MPFTEVVDAPKLIRSDGRHAFTRPQPGVTPTAAEHLSTKAYVDALKAYVDSQDILVLTLGSQAIDNAVNARTWKQAVRVASTTNLGLSGGATVDGVTVANGDRVLATAQSTGTQNGMWIVASGSWTRPFDMDSGAEFLAATFWVQEGTSNKGIWRCTNTTLNFGVDTATFEKVYPVPTAGIVDKAVTFAKVVDSAGAGCSVIGRSANSAGVFAEIAAASDNLPLRRLSNALGFGTVTATTALTMSTARILGRLTAGTGVVQEITVHESGLLLLNYAGDFPSSDGTILYFFSGGWQALDPGTEGQVLTVDGSGLPFWSG